MIKKFKKKASNLFSHIGKSVFLYNSDMGEQDQDLIRLFHLTNINIDNAIIIDEGGSYLNVHQLDVDPFEFLRQAENDYEIGGASARLNSITNSKRAINSQTDQALYTFGYRPTRSRINDIEKLNQLGIVIPRILKKVSDCRNLLEHQYKRPTEDQIAEALDLAYLYVYSIKPLLHNVSGDFTIANGDELIEEDLYGRHILFSTDDYKRPFSCHVRAVKIVEPPSSGKTFGKNELLGETYLFPKNGFFSNIIHILVDKTRGVDLDISLNNFILNLFKNKIS